MSASADECLRQFVTLPPSEVGVQDHRRQFGLWPGSAKEGFKLSRILPGHEVIQGDAMNDEEYVLQLDPAALTAFS